MRFVAAIGALFVLIALALAIPLAGAPVLRARASLGWEETHCQIQRSDIESRLDSEGTVLKRAVVQYTYEVSGRWFSADRIDFAMHDWSNIAVAPPPYALRTDVRCWYDPADPADATLSRRIPAPDALLFPLLFGIVGFVALKIGLRSAMGTAPETIGADGRLTYTRRGSTPAAVTAIATMWLVVSGIVILAIAVAEREFLTAIGAAAAVATWIFVHELRSLATRITIVAPPRLRRDETGRVDWQVRSLRGTPWSAASLVAIASRSTLNMLGGEYEVNILPVCTIPVEEDAAQPGSGQLRLPDDAPVSTRERQVDWFVQIHIDLPPGPHVRVRVPIEV